MCSGLSLVLLSVTLVNAQIFVSTQVLSMLVYKFTRKITKKLQFTSKQWCVVRAMITQIRVLPIDPSRIYICATMINDYCIMYSSHQYGNKFLKKPSFQTKV